MSQQNTPSLSQYYGRFLRRFWQDVQRAVWEAVLAVIAIVVVLFLQFYFGWIRRDETFLSALINVSPSVAILLAYVARHIARTPWLLDVDRENKAQDLAGDISKLNERIETLTSDLTRPKFTLRKPSTSAVAEHFGDDRHTFNFTLENNGAHSAFDMHSRIVLAEEGVSSEPKSVDSSLANELAINDPFEMQLSMTMTRDEPPLYIVVAARYNDTVTGKVFRQVFYLKWKGVKSGVLSQDIEHLTIAERDIVQQRFKGYLTDFT